MPNSEITVQRRLSLPVGHHFLLFLLFLGLKLGGVINWHWFWVCLPMVLKISFVGATLFYKIFISGGDEQIDNDE